MMRGKRRCLGGGKNVEEGLKGSSIRASRVRKFDPMSTGREEKKGRSRRERVVHVKKTVMTGEYSTRKGKKVRVWVKDGRECEEGRPAGK